MNIGAFCCDGFGRGESAFRIIFLEFDRAKSAGLSLRLELVSYLAKGRFSHAATKRGGKDGSLVGDGLPLEDALAGEADGLFRMSGAFRPLFLLTGTGAGRLDDTLRLVSELGCHLPMAF
ncbi:hypothetical protein [Edaphobacter aggregans]|uniref:hypothetical protein n=1 Tax=Edaphobacter aggregans TaxID=570835 RepID=UPI001FDEABAC|nr:hypothetical protein [Edaphobacter aggregans]